MSYIQDLLKVHANKHARTTLKDLVLKRAKIVDGCWLWQGSAHDIENKKQPRVKIDSISDHSINVKVALLAFTSSIEVLEDWAANKNKVAVKNTCGNFNCVNPEHLEILERKGRRHGRISAKA